MKGHISFLGEGGGGYKMGVGGGGGGGASAVLPQQKKGGGGSLSHAEGGRGTKGFEVVLTQELEV